MFGDSGFDLGPSIITPFRRTANQDPAEVAWNRYENKFQNMINL